MGALYSRDDRFFFFFSFNSSSLDFPFPLGFPLLLYILVGKGSMYISKLR